MASCRVVVGRLLEIDLGRGFHTPDEIDAFVSEAAQIVQRVPPGERLVLVGDWRNYELSGPRVADRIMENMRRNNPVFERNAMLHGPSHPTAVLQLFRIVQESGDPTRRLFTDPEALIDWIAEVLSPAEVERARVFLDI